MLDEQPHPEAVEREADQRDDREAADPDMLAVAPAMAPEAEGAVHQIAGPRRADEAAAYARTCYEWVKKIEVK